MPYPDIERALATAIDAESRVGTPWWPVVEMAPVAFRRWSSYGRRHPKARRPTTESRVLDLAKGLQAHFEPDVPFTSLSEWLRLSETLARVFATKDAGPHYKTHPIT